MITNEVRRFVLADGDEVPDGRLIHVEGTYEEDCTLTTRVVLWMIVRREQ